MELWVRSAQGRYVSGMVSAVDGRDVFLFLCKIRFFRNYSFDVHWEWSCSGTLANAKKWNNDVGNEILNCRQVIEYWGCVFNFPELINISLMFVLLYFDFLEFRGRFS